MKSYKVIGLMSGTSLDGLDIAACHFSYSGKSWSYQILAARTYIYPSKWQTRLNELHQASAAEFCLANTEYGHFIGKIVNEFLLEHNFMPDLIASHGHTIFHQPNHSMTVQIGSGSAIAAETGLPVVCDFRSTDIALGGQGAPLVPIGDRLLFSSYTYCLNLGGFSNVSFESGKHRVAFDICPVNIVLNHLSFEEGYKYDDHGNIANAGILHENLYERLNNLDYYHTPPPKSLGREWVEANFLPILDKLEISTADKLRTVCEHIAFQVSQVLDGKESRNVLVTGGGAYNDFLMSRIRNLSLHNYVVPEPLLIEYKEAVVFALLGLLRILNKVNVLQSVTGASRSSCSGSVYMP
jgi:anhydro-N-acetylmuramic acid kinase